MLLVDAGVLGSRGRLGFRAVGVFWPRQAFWQVQTNLFPLQCGNQCLRVPWPLLASPKPEAMITLVFTALHLRMLFLPALRISALSRQSPKESRSASQSDLKASPGLG